MTVFFSGVVMAQAGNAFACRTEVNRGRTLGWTSNRFLLLGVAVEIVLVLILTCFQPLATALYHVALPLTWWVWLAPYGLILYSLDWVRKSLRRSQSQVKVNRKAVA
jgi:sodium/potassium-transporting ATPase subunit alpha